VSGINVRVVDAMATSSRAGNAAPKTASASLNNVVRIVECPPRIDVDAWIGEGQAVEDSAIILESRLGRRRRMTTIPDAKSISTSRPQAGSAASFGAPTRAIGSAFGGPLMDSARQAIV
jgi:hypothetical protein